MVNSFYANVPYHLIQSIRLVHALIESDYQLHIPSEHTTKFSRLVEAFDIKFVIGINDVLEIRGLNIDHSLPQTSIGSINRPLIFPHILINQCRSMWPETRSTRYSFAGLVTEKRKNVLNKWLKKMHPHAAITLNNNNATGGSELISVNKEDVLFWSSLRGRNFPGKSWDADYYNMLANSQFVLCPSGDYIWSYRFFEAALCGAMPVIESFCPSYEGFYFHTMEDDITRVDWDQKKAEHNFITCKERLTIPKSELNAEIKILLSNLVG